MTETPDYITQAGEAFRRGVQEWQRIREAGDSPEESKFRYHSLGFMIGLHAIGVLCPNNAEFREHWMNYVSEIVRGMLDGVSSRSDTIREH